MKEIIAAVKTVIEQLRQAEILNLILGLAAALGVLLLFKFLTMFAGRRLEITPVRRSLKLLSLLTALMVFLMIMSSIEFLRILNSFVFFLIILVFIKITDYALVDRYLIHKKQLTITRLPRDTIKGIVFIALFLVMLRSFFGVSLSGIGITAAVATGVIGIALQDTLASVIAGISISIEKPFKVGDWIRVNNLEGRVEQINWRTTRIRTFNDDYVVMPNFTISKTEMINFYAPTKAHAREIQIGVGYEHPPEQVKAALLQAVAGIPGILEHPEPLVRLVNYGDFSISYKTKFWIRDFSLYPEIEDAFSSKIWYIFKRHGITIPFPIRDVRIAEKKKAPPNAGKVTADELTDISILNEIPAAARKIIASYMTRRLYGKNEIVFRKGEPGTHLYCIKRGSVQVEARRSAPVRIESGGLFGEYAMITGKERNATIITDSECEMFLLHRNDLKEVFKKHPDVTKKLVALIDERQSSLPPNAAEAVDAGTGTGSKPRSILSSLRKYLGL